MECGNCGSLISRVVKTQHRRLLLHDGSTRTIIQRRRECVSCGARFTTRETVQGAVEPLKQE